MPRAPWAAVATSCLRAMHPPAPALACWWCTVSAYDPKAPPKHAPSTGQQAQPQALTDADGSLHIQKARSSVHFPGGLPWQSHLPVIHTVPLTSFLIRAQNRLEWHSPGSARAARRRTPTVRAPPPAADTSSWGVAKRLVQVRMRPRPGSMECNREQSGLPCLLCRELGCGMQVQAALGGFHCPCVLLGQGALVVTGSRACMCVCAGRCAWVMRACACTRAWRCTGHTLVCCGNQLDYEQLSSFLVQKGAV